MHWVSHAADHKAPIDQPEMFLVGPHVALSQLHSGAGEKSRERRARTQGRRQDCEKRCLAATGFLRAKPGGHHDAGF